jgi:hypothetical protein
MSLVLTAILGSTFSFFSGINKVAIAGSPGKAGLGFKGKGDSDGSKMILIGLGLWYIGVPLLVWIFGLIRHE